jgi:hypothetical protein
MLCESSIASAAEASDSSALGITILAREDVFSKPYNGNSIQARHYTRSNQKWLGEENSPF